MNALPEQSLQALPPMETIRLNVPRDDAADYIMHLIEVYFEEQQIPMPLVPLDLTKHSPTHIQPWYYCNGIPFYSYVWHIMRTVRYMGRNNPYRLPIGVYIVIVAFGFLQVLFHMAAAVLEVIMTDSKRLDKSFGGATIILRGLATSLGCIFPFVMFLFPALVANLRETIDAYGYRFDGTERPT